VARDYYNPNSICITEHTIKIKHLSTPAPFKNSGEERVLSHHIMLHLKEAETPEYRELTQSCPVCGEEKTAEYCTTCTFLLPLKSHHRFQKPLGW